jgi:cGMP-inhibited 3',5'-cyclic phosphodiesterase A
LSGGGLGTLLNVDAHEYLAILTAAGVHDFEHPGVNNVFLQKMQDPIAIRYNDLSVLENHHIAAAFELMMRKPANNWAYRLENGDY